MRKITQTIFLGLVFLSTLSTASNVVAGNSQRAQVSKEIIDYQDAIEAQSLKISLNKNLKGFVVGKICDYCKTIKVIISPKTKAFENEKEVALIKAKSRLGRKAVVFFERESKKVTKIHWYTRSRR